MNRIIFDTDGGADDLLALLYAVDNPKLRIKSIITSYGCFTVKETTSRILNLLKLIKQNNHIDIYYGASGPIESQFVPDYKIHGRSLISEKDCSTPNEVKKFEENKIIDQERVTYVCTGPLTNLAKLLKTDNAKKIEKIIILGGALFYPGNATPLSEANLYWDPLACKRVFANKHKIPIYLIPINQTEPFFLSDEDISKIKYSHIVNMFFSHYQKYYQKIKKFTIDPLTDKKIIFKGGVIHDIFPFIWLSNKKTIVFRKMKIATDLILENRGHIYPILRPEQKKEHKDSAEIFVAISVSKILFWRTFFQLFKKGEL